jgi:hypothetical protein
MKRARYSPSLLNGFRGKLNVESVSFFVYCVLDDQGGDGNLEELNSGCPAD